MTSFHRHLELSLCVVFCNSAEIFRKILLNDWSSKLRTGNFVVEFLTLAVDKYQSPCNSKLRLMQPTFNRPATEHWVWGALRQVKKMVLLSLEVRKAHTLRTLYVMITTVPGISDLLAQHLVFVLVLTGYIPLHYGSQAIMCKGTKTWSRLVKEHNLRHGQIHSFMTHVASEQDWTQRDAKNASCKWLSDTASQSKTKYLDCVYPHQDTISYVDKTEGVYRVRVVRRDDRSDRSRKARYLVFSHEDILERSRHDVYDRDNKF